MRFLLVGLLSLGFIGSSTARAEDREAARQAFAQGHQHFDLGEYKEALESFKLAYRNYADPKILFNLAQCHRQLGNKEEAISFYRKYLNKVPNAPNREDVQNTIDKLNAALQAERTSKTTPPQGTLGEPLTGPPEGQKPAESSASGVVAPSAASSTATPAATAEKKPLTKKWWFWTAVGGGVVVVVALGVGLGVGLSHGSNQGSTFPGVAF
jgi:tetratricopeptide (TPR) repeat protein